MVGTTSLRNESGLDFVDIASEAWREYTFADGAKVRITEPVAIHVSESGHRILDSAGISHFVPLGWIHLHWQAHEGLPHFVL